MVIFMFIIAASKLRGAKTKSAPVITERLS
jgi:hypothetical protein